MENEEKAEPIVGDNDIVYLEFDLWVKESNDLYDSTSKEKAEEHNIFDENASYEPIPIVVDEKRSQTSAGVSHYKGHVPPIEGIIAHIKGAKVGEDREVEIPPEKAFGSRDPKLVELRSRRDILRAPEFSKGDIAPTVGMNVTLGNKVGWISMVSAGRVRVDFNNRLAGKALKYTYKVVKKAETTEDKVLAIIDINYGSSDGFIPQVEGDSAIITLPEICRLDMGWFSSKIRVVADLREYLNLSKVTFLEEYIRKEKKEEKEEKDETTKEEEPLEIKEVSFNIEDEKIEKEETHESD
jgi:FKBP-type peptidyl-prolyl cis-trans isomerase 2